MRDSEVMSAAGNDLRPRPYREVCEWPLVGVWEAGKKQIAYLDLERPFGSICIYVAFNL